METVTFTRAAEGAQVFKGEGKLLGKLNGTIFDTDDIKSFLQSKLVELGKTRSNTLRIDVYKKDSIRMTVVPLEKKLHAAR